MTVADAVTVVVAVAVAGMALWRGSWEFIGGYGFVFVGLWWGSWPLTLGLLPGIAAEGMRDRKGLAIVLPTLAAWMGLAIGWWIYRAVHPA
ncbi:hypothetical protein [Limnothrix sp. FACHB-1088]|uniref:hypothetical protein n=1 Tax=Limnothrix sp. FACHB-1088 TaxID=2692816 RepID=UPI001F54A66B|nr:hypothetical protein [Limnothrix sp. FACHB-1088]